MRVYVKRVKVNGRAHYYLVVEEYIGGGKRLRITLISVREILEMLGIRGVGTEWCGGRDLNPRRPTPSGPEPDPFGQARAPPPFLYGRISWRGFKVLTGSLLE